MIDLTRSEIRSPNRRGPPGPPPGYGIPVVNIIIGTNNGSLVLGTSECLFFLLVSFKKICSEYHSRCIFKKIISLPCLLILKLNVSAFLSEFVWSQEEPRNMGPWFFVKPRMENILGIRVGRNRDCRSRAVAREGRGETLS